jgi:hypothetical protein
MRYVPFLVVLGAAAFGQQITPTRIGPHHMGETLQEWAAISHELDDLDAVCRSRKHGLEGKVLKENCKRLENIRDGKQNVVRTSNENRLYTWHFDDGKLSAVKIDVPDPSIPQQTINIREEIDGLVEAYGKPSSRKTVSYHNAYGLAWECSELYWTMPDGTQIAAVESVNQHDDRVLEVVLLSKGAKTIH